MPPVGITIVNQEMERSLHDKLLGGGFQVDIKSSSSAAREEMENELDFSMDPFMAEASARQHAQADTLKEIETDIAIATERYGLLPMATDALSSTKYPELALYEVILSLGIDTLRSYSQLMDSSDEAIKQCMDPLLRKLLKGFLGIPFMSLYSKWTPRPLKPMVEVNLTSPGATPGSILQDSGSENGCWISTSSKDKWWSCCRTRCTVTAIKINWTSADSLVGKAPATLFISAAPLDENGVIDAAALNDSDFVQMAVYNPETEFKRQQSWTQIYPIRIHCPAVIRIACIGRAAGNPHDCAKVYQIKAFRNVDESQRLNDCLTTLRDVQSLITPLYKFSTMEDVYWPAMVSLCGMSGSLSITLNLVDFLLQSQCSDRLLRFAMSDVNKIFETIAEEKLKAERTAEQLDVNAEGPVDNVVFGGTTQGISILNDGKVMQSPHDITNTNLSASMIDGCYLSSGVWSFTFRIEKQAKQLVFLGLKTRSDSKFWMVDGITGKAVCTEDETDEISTASNETEKSEIEIIYNATLFTLSVHVNQGETVEVFQQVPTCCIPFVVTQAGFCKVEIVSVRHKGKWVVRKRLNSIRESPPDLSDPFVLPLALMDRMSSLASLASPELYGDAPFSLEPRFHTIEKLSSMLDFVCEWRLNQNPRNSNELLSALLRLLSPQLHVICGVDFEDVDFHHEECAVSRGFKEIRFLDEVNQVISNLRLSLESLVNDVESNVSLLAATALSTGCRLFYPTVVEQLERATCLYDCVLDLSSKNEAWAYLLKQFVSFLNIPRFLSNIALSCKGCWESVHTVALTDFLSKSFDFLDICLSSTLSSDPGLSWCRVGSELDKDVVVLLSRIQEYIAWSCAEGKSFQLFEWYARELCRRIIPFLGKLQSSGLSEKIIGGIMRNSWFTSLFEQFLYLVGLLNDNLSFVIEVAPVLCSVLLPLTAFSAWFKPSSQAVSSVIDTVITSMKISRRASKSDTAHDGWLELKPVCFEADPSSSESFETLEGGLLYSSVESSNTCAVAPLQYPKTYQRAAWEFELVADSENDECALFGAARLNPASRCYTTSPDLWLRRAYNGYLYSQGRHSGPSMEKIHPGETVRVEHDIYAGTISFGKNGGDVEVGFTGVTEQVFPCCGSYRSGVQIRLIKVEIFGGHSATSTGNHRPTTVLWKVVDGRMTHPASHKLHMIPTVDSRNKKPTVPEKLKALTTRTEQGVSSGIHRWSVEMKNGGIAPFAIGFVFGGDPPPNVPLGYPETIAPVLQQVVNESETITRAEQTAQEASGLIASVNSALTRIINKRGTKTSENHTEPAIRDSTVNFPLSSLAWHSDGSLWMNGEKKFDKFGGKHLPLQSLDAPVIMQLDWTDGTVSFYIEDELVGVAFGPIESDACVKANLSELFEKGVICYPAATIYSPSQTLKLAVAGLQSTVVVPSVLQVQKGCGFVVSNLISALLRSSQVSDKEKSLLPWFETPLLLGGCEDEVEKDRNDMFSEFLNDIAQFEDSPNAFKNSRNSELLLRWLERINPDPPTLRKVLEAAGTYSFPHCEMPFIAALLKHADLLREVQAIVASLAECQNDEELESKLVSHLPSDDVKALWTRVKQLRVQLRRERQLFLHSSSTNLMISEPEKFSAVHVEPSDALSLSNENELLRRLADVDSGLIVSRSNVRWHRQPDSVISRFNAQYSCRILAVGVDFDEDIFYVRFHVRGDNSLGPLQSPTSSSLIVTPTDSRSCDAHVYATHNPNSEILGTLRFSVELSNSMVYFQFGHSGYSRQLLQIPDEMAPRGDLVLPVSISATQPSKGPPLPKPSSHQPKLAASFSEYCNKLRERSLCLLKFKRFGSTEEKNRSAVAKMEMGKSEGTDEKWRKTVSSLRHRLKIRKHSSILQMGEVSPSPLHTLDDDLSNAEKIVKLDRTPSLVEELESSTEVETSPAQTALQACCLFLAADDIAWEPETLLEVIRLRQQRAEIRKLGFEQLHLLLSNEDIAADWTVAGSLIVAVQPALSQTSSSSSSDSDDGDLPKSHYLVNLEGCPPSILTEVQTAFAKCYESLCVLALSLLSNFDDSCPLRSRNFLACKAYDFVNELISAWTLCFSARDQRFLLHCGILPILFRFASFATLEQSCQRWMNAAIGVAGYLPSSFSGDALCPLHPSRLSSLLQLYLIPTNKLSWQTRRQLGITGDFVYNYSQRSASDLQLLAEVVNRTILTNGAKDAKQREKLQSDEFLMTREVMQRCGGFDPDFKGPDIVLDAADKNLSLTITTPSPADPQVAYTTIALSEDKLLLHGNYFEVEILVLGKGEIGVGLAVKNLLSTTGRMPGWESGSYAYHGDDGLLHGVGCVDRRMPLFRKGDIIGCGMDFTVHRIFFTRNGQLLSGHFESVNHEILHPVVGFARGIPSAESVRINFGAKPFVFGGAEVVVTAGAKECHRRLEEITKMFQEKSTEQLSSTHSPPIDSDHNEIIRRLDDMFLADCMLFCAKKNQRVSCMLLRQLLLQSMEVAIKSDDNLSEMSTLLPLPLMKGISSFGTPLNSSLPFAATVVENIVTFFAREILLAVDYLSSIAGDGIIVAANRPLPPTGKTFAKLKSRAESVQSQEAEPNQPVMEPEAIENVIFWQMQLVRCSLLSPGCLELTVHLILPALFTLLRIGSLAIFHESIFLLTRYLPFITPDEADGHVDQRWKELLDAPEVMEGDSQKKKRKIPDLVIRLLCHFMRFTNCAVFDEENKKTIEPVGFGDAAAERAMAALKLVQNLLKSPSWLEVISCFMTDSLRMATSCIENIELAEKSRVEVLRILVNSHATALVLGGHFDFLLPRSEVVYTFEGKAISAWVIDLSNSERKCEITVSELREPVNLSKVEIDIVPLSSLKLVANPAPVNYSTLSQPLLPQLTSFLAALLRWYHEWHECGSLSGFLIRLTADVSFVFSNLLSSHRDAVLDLIMDLGIAPLFHSCSLIPASLPGMPPIHILSEMTRFFRFRCNERKLNVNVISRLASTSLPVSDEEKESVVSLICRETNCPPSFVKSRLEFFGGNVVECKKSLARDQNGVVELESSALPATEVADRAPVMSFHDDNIFDNIDNVAMQEVAFVGSREPGEEWRAKEWQLGEISRSSELSRFIGAYFVESSNVGQSDAVGPLLSRVETYDSNDADHIIAVKFDRYMGFSKYSLIPLESLRMVAKCFGVAPSRFAEFSICCEKSIIASSLREIMGILLASGSRNMPLDPSQWVAQFKFSFVHEIDETRLLTTLERGVVQKDTVNDEESLLLKDSIEQLDQLVTNPFRDVKNSNRDGDSPTLIFASPHPFPAPHSTGGKINVPSSWTAVKICFHSKCSIPSPLAGLHFFLDEESFHDDKPTHSFWGSGIGRFHDITISNPSSLYYRFSAITGSNRKPLLLRDKDDHILDLILRPASEGKRSVLKSVGLGDDDTLANLFALDDEEEEAGGSEDSTEAAFFTSRADCLGCSSGCWYFEVKVLEAKGESNLPSSKCSSIGIVASTTDQKFVKYCFNGEISADSHQQTISSEFGSIAKGDVLGCLFLFDSIESVMSVRFVKNGVWSTPVVAAHEGYSWLPRFELTKFVSLEVNFGEDPFAESPANISARWEPMLSRPIENESEIGWGYQFTVEPLKELSTRICREFTQQFESDGSKEKKKDSAGEGSIWIWKAKALGDYLSCGDVITFNKRPPVGALMIAKSQGRSPLSFERVSSDAKPVVWRPIAPEGFHSLGYVFSSSPPNRSEYICVPSWAVEACDVGKRLFISKQVTKESTLRKAIWTIDNGLGTFFAVGFSSKDAKSAEMCNGWEPFPDCWKLRSQAAVEAKILGEWIVDEDILCGRPSFSWCLRIISLLLKKPFTARLLLQSDLFSLLVKYLRADCTPSRIKVVKPLIDVIRASFAPDQRVSLPLELLEDVCRNVLKRALTKLAAKDSLGLSEGMLNLVDLVIEVVSVHIHSTLEKENASQLHAIDRRAYLAENLSDLLQQAPWFVQRSRVSFTGFEHIRLMKRSKMESIFAKPSIVRKIKQAVRFFASLRKRSEGHRLLYPRYLIGKIWNDRASAMSFCESVHPQELNVFGEIANHRFIFPGATSVKFIFDSRCELSPQSRLTISGLASNSIKTFSHDNPIITEPNTARVYSVNGSDVTLSYVVAEVTDSQPPDVPLFWGWAVTVIGIGDVFESAFEDLETTLFVEISSLSAEMELQGVSDPFSEQQNSSFSAHSGGRPISRCSSRPGSPAKPRNQSITTGGVEELFEAVGDVEKLNISNKELLLSLITRRGQLCRSGEMFLPHAHELELAISRPNIMQPVDAAGCPQRVFYALQATYETKDEPIQSQNILITQDESIVDTYLIPSGKFDYHLRCLSETVIENWINSYRIRVSRKDSEENSSQTLPTSALKPEVVDVPPRVEESDQEHVESTIADTMWPCPVCTVCNDASSLICVVCDTPRLMVDGAFEAASGSTAASRAGWWCSACTFINALGSRTCAMCGTAMDMEADADVEQRSPSPNQANADLDGIGGLPTEDDEDSGSSCSEDDSESDRLVESKAKQLTPSSPRKDSKSKAPPQLEDFVQATRKSKRDIIRLTITGRFRPVPKFETRLEGALMRPSSITPPDIQTMMMDWTDAQDKILLEHINRLQSESVFVLDGGILEKFVLPVSHFQFQAAALSCKTMLDIQLRAVMFHSINRDLTDLLPIVNLRNSDPLSFGATIRKFCKYIFLSTKQPLLTKALKASATVSGNAPVAVPAVLSLDNYKASESHSQISIEDSKCCFVQAFNQLSAKDSCVYRYSFSDNRVFQITFVGESGIDAGGVFREGMSRMIEDLFSPRFELLKLCPNGENKVHCNMDKYVPNSQLDSELATRMFQFVGKLMGVSLRTKLQLPFQFPSIVWKKMVGEECSDDDWMLFDSLTCKLIRDIETCERDGIADDESFHSKFNSKLLVELFPTWSGPLVSFSDRRKFCAAVREAKLGVFDRHVDAMIEGFQQVVPLNILQLFSWEQLEILVAGSPVINIALWKSKTESSGVSSKTVELFWKVMESLTPEEQAGFVRFAWGRSRLPTDPAEFTSMRLTTAGSSTLPQSHTCFFSVELPEYRTEEEMRRGLLTVINFGVGGILNG